MKALTKGKVSEGYLTHDHVVIFSSINLLQQATITSKEYDNCVMTCIDSTHDCGDANGGKPTSFGIVLHRTNGHQGSDCCHGYILMVFARVLEEKEESALYMLSALGKAIRDLFGISLDFRAELVSYHANSFVNAYKRFLPNSPRGQC
jgi:hypothetical protein